METSIDVYADAALKDGRFGLGVVIYECWSRKAAFKKGGKARADFDIDDYEAMALVFAIECCDLAEVGKARIYSDNRNAVLMVEPRGHRLLFLNEPASSGYKKFAMAAHRQAVVARDAQDQ